MNASLIEKSMRYLHNSRICSNIAPDFGNEIGPIAQLVRAPDS